MSFKEYKEVISEGDTVILYLNINSMYALVVEPKIKNKKGELVDNVFQTTYGSLKVMSLVGEKFGSRVDLSRGWAYVLHPTPELWTLTLPHRTQIIYSLDISVIIHQLEVSPGKIVAESGTGSGSLSHALIRGIQPSGHLHTFDFHATRVEIAQKEFVQHGIGEFVTIKQRDVCADGFGEDLVGKVDAVFLDLPHPWDAVPHAAKVFRRDGGRFCSFSPCIEQVQRTCLALRNEGFDELNTMECLQTEYQVQARTFTVLDLDSVKESDKPILKGGSSDIKQVVAVPPQTKPGHTGYLTFATMPPVWARRRRPTADSNGASERAAEPEQAEDIDMVTE